MDFLCEHKFDFNKVGRSMCEQCMCLPLVSPTCASQLFHDGIHYLNSRQEAELRDKEDGKQLSEQ